MLTCGRCWMMVAIHSIDIFSFKFQRILQQQQQQQQKTGIMIQQPNQSPIEMTMQQILQLIQQQQQLLVEKDKQIADLTSKIQNFAKQNFAKTKPEC